MRPTTKSCSRRILCALALSGVINATLLALLAEVYAPALAVLQPTTSQVTKSAAAAPATSNVHTR